MTVYKVQSQRATCRSQSQQRGALSLVPVLLSLASVCLPGFHLERCGKPGLDHPLQIGILTQGSINVLQRSKLAEDRKQR